MKNTLLRYLMLLCLTLAPSLVASAEALSVRSLVSTPMDITARKEPRKDRNGVLCAAVRVLLPIEGCKFEGSVIESVFDTNGYVVYMTDGARQLRIKCPGHETIDVVFGNEADFNALESGLTYELRLDGYQTQPLNVKTDPGANYLLLTIEPSDAPGISVKIDGQLQAVNNNQLSKYLPYGVHTYEVEASGFAPSQGTVTIAKGDKTRHKVVLESVLAHLEVLAATPGATITVNGEKSASDAWKGNLLAGIYEISASKEGHRPYTTTINIAEKENKTIQIPELNPIYGSLSIGYEPIDAEITIDGKSVGTTPLVIDDILVGTHKINIKKEGFQPYTGTVNVEEGKPLVLEGTLKEISKATGGQDGVTDMKSVEQKPSFPGGDSAMWQWLVNNINYPPLAAEEGVSGKVIVQFVVEKDGSLSNVTILRGKHPALDAEAVRVVKKMPKWNPGRNNGEPVRTKFVLPINFRLAQ